MFHNNNQHPTNFNSHMPSNYNLYNGNKYNNIYNAFKPADNFITQRPFRNKGDLLNNNIDEYVLHQDVNEITIHIDSADRDYKIYPNPFDFKVTFNPSGSRTIDGIKFGGTAKPTVPINFDNVKYIKLEVCVLPRNVDIRQKYVNDESVELKDRMMWDYSEKTLDRERFLIMQIKEIDSLRVYGTNDNLCNSFGNIYCDKILGKDYFTGIPFDCSKIYGPSLLGNIRTWSIQLLDSFGKQLNIDVDNNVNTPKYCICDNPQYKNKNHCVCKYVKHPLNPKFQVFYSFKIGVIENELNTTVLKT